MRFPPKNQPAFLKPMKFGPKFSEFWGQPDGVVGVLIERVKARFLGISGS